MFVHFECKYLFNIVIWEISLQGIFEYLITGNEHIYSEIKFPVFLLSRCHKETNI